MTGDDVGMTETPAAAPAIDAARQRLLAALLDELVPPRAEAALPGAGALGLADAVARSAAENPGLASVLAETLVQLAALAQQHGGTSFPDLDPRARRVALDALAARAPGSLPALCFLTYAAYYRDPRVLEAIGHPPRPPYPLGYEVPPTDFGLLEPVRRRAPFYRSV